MMCMKLMVMQLVSNNGSLELVHCSNLSISSRPHSGSFPSKNLNLVSSRILRLPLCESTFLMYVIQADKAKNSKTKANT